MVIAKIIVLLKRQSPYGRPVWPQVSLVDTVFVIFDGRCHAGPGTVRTDRGDFVP